MFHFSASQSLFLAGYTITFYFLSLFLSPISHALALAELSDSGSTKAELKNCYQFVEIPLTELFLPLYPTRDLLLKAWQVASDVTRLDAHLLAQVLIVAIETRVDDESELLRLPALELNHQEAVVQPTAAHPRAYRGTKYQPPKPARPPAINLQPYLCNNRDLNILLLELREYWSAALAILAQHGYQVDRLAVDKLSNDAELYYLYHFSFAGNVGALRLPTKFNRYLLPLLKERDWSNALEYLDLYWALSLERKQGLLAGITRLIHIEPNTNGLQWCRLIAQQSRGRRAIFATLLIKSSAHQIECNDAIVELIERFNAITPGKYYASRLYTLLRALKQGISIDYLMAGFEFANRYYPKYDFEKLSDCPDFPNQRIAEIFCYLDQSREFFFSLEVWQCCGEWPGFVQLIAEIDWQEWSPDIAAKYLKFYVYRFEDEIADYLPCFPILKRQSGTITQLLAMVKRDYQEKFIISLSRLCDCWNKSEQLAKYLPISYRFLIRICQPPFLKQSKISRTISDFVDADNGQLQERFWQLPDSSLLKLEKEFRSEDGSILNSTLIGDGLGLLIQRCSKLVIDALQQCVKRLCQTAKLLGSLRSAEQLHIIREFNNHKLLTDISGYSLADACAFIDENLSDNLSNPVPVKLREHLDNKRRLDKAKFEHYCQQFYKQLTHLRLDLLTNLIVKDLSKFQPINLDNQNEIFALQMLRSSDENHRAFKRFLKAHLNGNRQYLITHFLTQEWLKKHSNLNLELWLNGIEFQAQSDRYGVVKIELEKDPLEALKLGHYVDSCLGLGGLCDYSAAAVVLDINKQVLYLRDCKNRVIARQLIAISQVEQLVCFRIYPYEIDKEIKLIFRDYDRRFAAALNIPIFGNEEDDGYKIEHILSKGWWDDGVWNLQEND